MTLTLNFTLASFRPSAAIPYTRHQMRFMLRQHEANPKAGAALGFVYRVLWYLQWKDDPNPRERAKQSSRLLLSSIRSFHNVQRLHPEEYLSGYNALLLMAVTAELFPGIELPPRLVDRDELAVVVRYAANSARENARRPETVAPSSGAPLLYPAWKC